MSELSIDMMDDVEAQDYELMRFECWYHSVIDDLASLIRSNGYDTVMLDVMQAVERMSKDEQQ